MLRALVLFAGCLLVQGCQDAWWCPDRIAKTPEECYYYKDDCCVTCKKYATGPEGCEWGNRAGDEWCEGLTDFQCTNYHDQCCKTCGGSDGTYEPTTSRPQMTTRKPTATRKPNNNHDGPVQCGQTPIQPNLNHFVVGGVEARPNSLPWQVGMGQDGWGQGCGGSIINKNTIVTAAHCVKPGVSYYVIVGQHKKYGYYDKYYKQHVIREVIIHPDYRSVTRFDIAILKTEEEIEFNDGVQPICLPPSDQEYAEDDTMFLASGWGSLGNGYATHLMQVALPYISTRTCQRLLGTWNIHEKVICAGYLAGGKDSCQGDSGGPLATVIDGKWTLAGVVSWGFGCAERNKPGVYTHVAKYIDFINEHA